MNIQVFNQSSIKLTGTKIIYFDSYLLSEESHDADYIFITHDHYDHYEEDSIIKALNSNTLVIVPQTLETKAKKITDNVLVVEPNRVYELTDLTIETISSYNNEAAYHPKEKGNVGYNVSIDGTKYYVMGDTDVTEETLNVKTDICFVPIGGTYTMSKDEAIDYINFIKPKKAIPIHYGSIVGDISLGEKFKEKINKDIEVEILIK